MAVYTDLPTGPRLLESIEELGKPKTIATSLLDSKEIYHASW